jgi:hypothetical protein
MPPAAPMLFHVFHDQSEASDTVLDKAQIAYEYGRFTADLAEHYAGWPGIEASCQEQAEPVGGLMVRLVSDLPPEAVVHSLSTLLIRLNQRIDEGRIDLPRFFMRQVGRRSSQHAAWPSG